MNIKDLVGKRVSKEVKFLSENVRIFKLSVNQVMQIQEMAKAAEAAADEQDNLAVLRHVVRSAVEGGTDLADEDFVHFPMDELSKLSTEILRFSGIAPDSGK